MSYLLSFDWSLSREKRWSLSRERTGHFAAKNTDHFRRNFQTDIKLKTQLINYYTTINGIANVVDVNSDVTVGMYYRLDKDFTELGWSDISAFSAAIDTSRVDAKQFQAVNFPSPELKKSLISEALFYLGTNTRKRELYQTMAKEIAEMKSALTLKCP